MIKHGFCLFIKEALSCEYFKFEKVKKKKNFSFAIIYSTRNN